MGSLQNLGFLIANRLRIEATWRFHCCQGQDLGEVVLHHVPQGTGGFVVASPFFNANGFGCGDLHIGDIITIPDWLEDRVGKAQHQDVLNRFLAQVVVDAENLAFLGTGLNDAVQVLGAAVVTAKGFFDDDATAIGIGQ